MTEQVTDEMVKAAISEWLSSASDYTSLHVSIRAAIEAALAAREPVDAGELVRRLEEDENLDGLDEAIAALKVQAREIAAIKIERAELIDALKKLGVKI